MASDDQILFHPTPLHGRTAELARANLWAPWFGFSAVAAYGDVIQEVDALVRGAGIADFSPLPLYDISGRNAAVYLDRLLTRRTSSMTQGEVRDALACASSGHVISLCTVLRVAEDHFLVMSEGEIGTRLLASQTDGGVDIVRSDLVPIALFGPNRAELLSDLGLNQTVGESGFVARLKHDGVPLVVADVPSSATAGGGSFILVKPDDAAFEWDRILRRGKDLPLTPVGLEALERRRIDLGRPREGFEFHAAPMALRPEDRVLPIEIGLDHLVERDGRIFNGARALEAAVETRHLVCIEVDEILPLRGQGVRAEGKAVGQVTSAYEATELGVSKGLALLERGAAGALSIGPVGAAIAAHATPVNLS